MKGLSVVGRQVIYINPLLPQYYLTKPSPELSSRCSSTDSSRSSSIHSDSQEYLLGSLGKAEPKKSSLYIVNYDVLPPEPQPWTGTCGTEDWLWEQGSAEELLHKLGNFESHVFHKDVYRPITPNDTTESSRDGISESTSEVLDPNFDNDWQPFTGELGKEYLDELMSINKLAVALEGQGNYDEAEAMLQNTLQLGEALLGKENPNTLLSMGNLAGFLIRRGKYKEAAVLYNRVGDGYQKSLGPDHPTTLKYMEKCSLALIGADAALTHHLLSNFSTAPSGSFADTMLHTSTSSTSASHLSSYREYPHPPPNLETHVLTHFNERPLKCPVTTCDYHLKGFSREYDKNRHTLTHFKGIMVCGFCPVSGSDSGKSFNRADVFKRHLTSVHGVEQTPPSKRKNSKPKANAAAKCALASYCRDATGICSLCLVSFQNAQGFYEHLDDCVLREVLQDASNSIEDTSQKREVKKEASATETGEKSNGSVQESRSGHRLTHSKGGVDLSTKGRKKRKDYPASWGCPAPQTKMKKRVMCAFDGHRRLWKDDMMLSTDYEVRIPLSDGKSYVTDLDVQTLKRAEAFLNATEEEKGPYQDEMDLGKLMAIGLSSAGMLQIN
jgi:tetratricopeptide (TPR) repeat protein